LLRGETNRVEEPADPKTISIEQTFRKRRSGFLAWARQRTPDLETAEDVVQEAFLKAVSRVDVFLFVEDLAAWVFTVMRNLIADHWRADSVRRRNIDSSLTGDLFEEVVAGVGIDPQDTLVRDELQEALRVAVESLPKDQREVLEAQAIDGTTFRELSGKTGVSINTLMARKRRAIQKLTAALSYWIQDI
jgi:RNA polymerase sigma factor (sigma-70 family)